MPTELIPAKVQALTFYDTETDLAALLDTDALVTPEQRAEFQGDLQEAMRASEQKRDNVARFWKHLDYLVAFGEAEIKKLKERIDGYRAAQEKLEKYVVGVVQAIKTPDAKGKYPKLEGKTETIAIQRNPASVVIDDMEKVPLKFKDASISVRCSAERWVAATVEIRELFRVLDLEKEIGIVSSDAREILALICEPKSVQYSIRRADVKKAIEANESVPGADLQIGEYRLSTPKWKAPRLGAVQEPEAAE